MIPFKKSMLYTDIDYRNKNSSRDTDHTVMKAYMPYIALASTILMFASPVVSIALYGWNFVSNVEPLPSLFYLEPAGYSFIIWGLIYLGFLALGIYQVLPNQLRDKRFVRARKFIMASALVNIAWILAARMNLMWIMLLCTVIILYALIRLAALLELGKPSYDIRERLWVKVPIGAYFGWITLITPLSATGFLLYKFGWTTPSFLTPELWSVVALVGFFALVLVLLLRQQVNLSYLIVVIWGLFAIFISNLGNSHLVGFTALGLSMGLLITFFIVDRQQVELSKVKMELTALRNQVNPHFLFNNLNTLSNMIPLESKGAHQYLEKLANFYRYVVNQKDEHLIPLARELEGITQYIGILRERFGDHLKVDIQCQGIEKKLILPLSLQLLLENAVKHNSLTAKEPLFVKIYPTTDLSHLKIENNKNERINTLKSTGIGLKNIEQRYRYYTKKKIQIENLNNHFIVLIPLIDHESTNYRR